MEPETKVCITCKEELPLSSFWKERDSAAGLPRYRSRCKECLGNYNKSTLDYERKKAQLRVKHLKEAYGLTPEEFNRLLESQGNRCAICDSDDPRHKHGWHIEHDHITNKVRGIACSKCNTMLGALGDTREKIEENYRMLIRYLDRCEGELTFSFYRDGYLFYTDQDGRSVAIHVSKIGDGKVRNKDKIIFFRRFLSARKS